MEISQDLRVLLRMTGYDMDSYRNRSCVYTLLSDHGPVKIGFSREPFRRLAAINKGSFVKAAIYSLHPSARARDVEQLAHQRLATYRLDGEWFDVPVQFAERTVRDCLCHIEHGHELTDAGAEHFSRVWEFTGEFIDGDWGKIGQHSSYAEGFAPIRSWMAKRDEIIAVHFASETR